MTSRYRRALASAATAALLACCYGQGKTPYGAEPRHIDLYCHRTANQDVPENTLESLEQAVLLGCDLVEVDVRRTADGVLILNHDGFLERLTDGAGEVETSLYGDLRTRDAGSWMNDRFDGLHITTLRDALRLAKDSNVRLNLDVKTSGLGPDILRLLQSEGMQDRVEISGDWDDLRAIRSAMPHSEHTVWKQPGITAAEIQELHHLGKTVVVNFSANAHVLDILAMHAAVAAGADAINVDAPRLGADAVGRPVERRLATLAHQAAAGNPADRMQAILELSRYRGFELTHIFVPLVADGHPLVSRAAALALVNTHPAVPPASFSAGLHAPSSEARANAVWALGRVAAPSSILLPFLNDNDPRVVAETLLALAHSPDSVAAVRLLPLLTHSSPAVRGAAALALARHAPSLAATAIQEQLRKEVIAQRVIYDAWAHRGKPQLTPAEIRPITDVYRCQMEEVRALATLQSPAALSALEEQAFRNTEDYSQVNGLVASYQLWDRIAADPQTAIQALGSADAGAADRAEWMLIEAGPTVLPEVALALDDRNNERRLRAIRILVWQNDIHAIAALKQQPSRHPEDTSIVRWALQKLSTSAAP